MFPSVRQDGNTEVNRKQHPARPPGTRTLDQYFKARPPGASQPGPSAYRASHPFSDVRQPQTPSSNRLAIVLGSLPRHHQTSEGDNDDDSKQDEDHIISDLSPQFRRLAAQAAQSISLSKPALPEETKSPSKKPRGRPKGYRPGQVKGASSSQNGPRKLRTEGGTSKPKSYAPNFGKRRGRQPKPPPLKPREVYESLMPRFVRFICEWEGCRAELHNAETLRRHFAAVHGRCPSKICRWGRCPATQQPEGFATGDELRSHFEETHVPPIIWQAGEGPNVTTKWYTPDDEDGPLPDYLFGPEGEQVTPSIREQEVEDFMTWRDNRRKLKALLLVRDQNLPSEEEEDS